MSEPKHVHYMFGFLPWEPKYETPVKNHYFTSPIFWSIIFPVSIDKVILVCLVILHATHYPWLESVIRIFLRTNFSVSYFLDSGHFFLSVEPFRWVYVGKEKLQKKVL